MATVSYARTDQTTQAQAAIDCLEDALTRQGAWTKMATVMSGTSQPCSVWRCSGTRTALKRDWYLAVGRTVGTNPSSFSIAVAEGFDQSKGQLIRPAPGSAGVAANAPAEDFTYGGGSGFNIWSGNSLNSTDIAWFNVSISTTQNNVYAIVTNDTVAVIRDNGSSYTGTGFLAGIPETFRADDPGCVYLGDPSAGRVTRHPTITTTNSANWLAVPIGSSQALWTVRSGTLGSTGDRLHGSRPVGSRLLVRHTGSDAATGTLRGLNRNVVSINTVASTFNCGEKIFIGDDTYMFMGSNDLWFNSTPT